jgi:peptidyl-prolyl cis-trans isomerase C
MMNMRLSLKKPAVWALLITLTTWNVAVAKDEKKKQSIYQNTEVLARGPNGLVVTVSDILSEVNKMNPAMRSDFFKNQANVRQIANNLLVRRILAAEAQKEKLDRDLVVQAAMVVAKDRVLSDARLNQMDVANEPTEKAIEAYAQSKYKANIEKYEVPAQTRASHILIEKKDENSLKEAQSLVTKIKEGAKFEDMAKEFSKDPGSASRGGDLGFFTAGRMVKTFEDATNALAKPGDISDPVESQFGYHIIRLDERQAKTVKSFDEVRLQLMSEARADLLSQKRVQKVQAITNTMNFEDKAIENFSKEGLDAMTQK